ncbi:hypothetical protein SESBI_32582 [Sesbania bispinosa]|nr:hypothetical protein SESBI_32582 [Sesbania bispinosa]
MAYVLNVCLFNESGLWERVLRGLLVDLDPVRDTHRPGKVNLVRYTVPQATEVGLKVHNDLEVSPGFYEFCLKMSSKVRVEVEGDASSVVVGVASSERIATREVFPAILRNLEDVAVVSDPISKSVDMGGTIPVKKVKGKKKIADGVSSKQPIVKKKYVFFGRLRGSILKFDSEEKGEASYDFVNNSWVDPTIAGTFSVYRSSEETVTFTKENDFVRKDFLGTVECS